MNRAEVINTHLNEGAPQKKRERARDGHRAPKLNKMEQPMWAMHRVDRVPRDHLLPERSLKGQTLFITGASRGIGLAIALRAARDGANVVIAAKSVEEHPKLKGTIYSAAKEVEAAGGRALAVQVDVRDEASIAAALKAAADKFGGIDIVVNNASAINLAPTDKVDMKRYDLMHSINTRGTFLTTKLALPYLKKSKNPHVLNLSPPLNMEARWFAPHVAYTMAKFGMSMCVLGHAEEFKSDGIAVNALWPRTTIATAAVNNLLGGDMLMQVSRTPDVMADAAHCIFTRKSTHCTGNFFIDDEVLASEGVGNLDKYAVNPKMKTLAPDFFV
eukprot:PhM_4_TR2301/c0_g1_i2/m.83448/K13775/atuG; citronellol/citronellal dehydrogenase